ncbi:tyrosine-type recombinase/integrase [Corynebacterium lowii]|uniref:Tyrosine recombinase XerD n=1 Tax=Corynebacterium lowii TaxID=1544413 RepID=A0A0N8W0T7_9CORY|nr:Tyrosine recombinase XerD [Corynebacterium lowii]MDP9851793.1 integrase [Corynebacterium lowii]
MLISDSPYPLGIPNAWKNELREWEIYLRASALSPRSIDTRIRHLRYIARSITTPPHLVTSRDIILWSGSRDWSPESRHALYTSARAFFTWRCKWYQAENNPTEILPSVRRTTGTPRPIPEGELTGALFTDNPRTSLILRLAAEAGLRRSEIAVVHRDDIVTHEGHHYLTVHGKGNKIRTIPLTPSLHQAITTFMGPTQHWLFPGAINGHLSPGRIGIIASKALPEGWSLHSLRHRFATHAYHATHDILAVQEALGHNSLETTRRYTKVAPSSLHKITTATEIRLSCPEPQQEKTS